MKKLVISNLLIFTAFFASAQISGKSIPELRQEAAAPFHYSTPDLRYGTSLRSAFQPSSFPKLHSPIFLSSHPPLPSMPKSYSYEQLAFFCKIEVKMEKAAKLPIKFRLGDVDYVDRLEGKRE